MIQQNQMVFPYTVASVMLLVASGIVYCAETNEVNVDEAFIKAGIVPDVIPRSPPTILKAEYGTSTVALGNDIFATEAVVPPWINYTSEAGQYYTFIIIDPDDSSRAAPVLSLFIIALYVNIPGSNFEEGFSAAPYGPIAPSVGSGPHRYVLLVYRQTAELNIRNLDLIRLGVFRRRFSLTAFMQTYDITDLIAGNFFYSEIPTNFKDFC